MQRKIFIGIDLDVHLKKAVMRSLKKWKDLPIKWHKEESLHISLLSLGWVGEDDMLDINSELATFCQNNTGFSVDFEQIKALPKNPEDHDPSHAQVVRLIGKESVAMRDLYTRCAQMLDMPISEKKIFRPYVDIGRMRAQKWHDLAEHPQIAIPFSVTMDVSVITLFESMQIDSKREIVPIEVFDLQ